MMPRDNWIQRGLWGALGGAALLALICLLVGIAVGIATLISLWDAPVLTKAVVLILSLFLGGGFIVGVQNDEQVDS